MQRKCGKTTKAKQLTLAEQLCQSIYYYQPLLMKISASEILTILYIRKKKTNTISDYSFSMNATY